MKWELYLTRREWEEVKAAVRERCPHDEKTGRPCCERCGWVHGKLKRSKQGYMIPHWLHTVHIHGAPMKSKNPDDYLGLCDSCHMWYDRQPDSSGWVPQYRAGYCATTTDDLVKTLHGVGLDVWEEQGAWYWRIGEVVGSEQTPVLCVAAAVGRLERLLRGWMDVADRVAEDLLKPERGVML